jgi:hypothetical protein
MRGVGKPPSSSLKTVLKAFGARQTPTGINPSPRIRKNVQSASPAPDTPEPAERSKTDQKTRLYANTWHVYANRRHKTPPFIQLEAVLMDIKPIHPGLPL